MADKSKLEQNNQAYKKAIGEIILKVLPGVLPLTVSDVLLDPSFQHGRVWLSTTPEILKQVEAKRPEIQQQMKTKVAGRYTPRLQFLLDDHYLGKLDNLFKEVETELKTDED